MITIVPVRALKDNYIWLILDDIAHTAYVVDPGDATPVIQYLRHHHYTLAGILITHHHADHSGGIAGLLDEWNNVPVYGSIVSKVPQITHFVREGDLVDCGQLTLSVMEIPGHTLDHVAYYNDEIVFSGDTLFSAGCGRVFEGTYAQMYNSLTRLSQLPDSVKMYCGHEYTLQNLRFADEALPNNAFIQEKIAVASQLMAEGKPTLPSLMRDEKKMNPFLRCVDEDAFKVLREWKNRW